MRKILALCLAAILLVSMTACNNKEQTPTIGEVTMPSDLDAKVYPYNDEKIENEDGTKTYKTSYIVHTSNFYDVLTVDDIKYSTTNGMQLFSEIYQDAKLNVINVNNLEKTGTCAFIYIESPILIDFKKMYVYVEGPKTYDESISSKEDYVAKNGSTDGWYSMYLTVSSAQYPSDKIESTYTKNGSGVAKLYDDGRSMFKYELTDDVNIITGNTMLTKYKVTSLRNASLEVFAEQIETSGVPAMIDGEEYVVEDVSEKLSVYCIVEGEYVWIGYQTVDGSDFTNYDGMIPDCIVYVAATYHAFCVNSEN